MSFLEKESDTLNLCSVMAKYFTYEKWQIIHVILKNSRAKSILKNVNMFFLLFFS